MSIEDRGEKFREADRSYEEAARKRDAGEISAEEFDAERKRLMVLDKEGRWWAKSATTGEWRHYDGKEWVPGVPPGYEPPDTTASEDSEPGAEEGGTRPPDESAREVVADGDEERRSGVSLRRPVFIAAFLLVVLLAGGGYILSRGTTLTSGGGGMGGSGGSVAVPDLVGAASIEEARDAAGGDFEVEANEVDSLEPIGTVVSQEPSSGERAAPDSTISVDVSKGVSVPDVEGEPRQEAARILEGAGFEVEEKAEESSVEDTGAVIAQNPPEGKAAEAGSSVEITVGEGPPPDTGTGGGGDDGGSVEVPESGLTPVPDVVGEFAEDAERILEDAGFAATVETVESEEEAGVVVWTDPEPETPADAASTEVVLGVSSGPPTSSGPPDSESPESPPDEQYDPCC